MQTLNCFKDLRKLNCELVGRYTPYTQEDHRQRAIEGMPPIAVYINNDDEPTFIAKVIIRKYKDIMKWHKKKINNTLKPFYSRNLEFADNLTANMIERIRVLMESTGKTIKEMGKDFEAYLGYPCTFFRKENFRQVPVDTDRILKAYQAMKENKLIYEIEKILFR